MRKSAICILLSLLFISTVSVFADNKMPVTYSAEEDTPALLQGIWQGYDRLLFFGDENNEFSAVLRTFYQWYDDRAAEPSEYRQIKTRDRNNTSSDEAEDITVKFCTVVENASKTAGVYEIQVKYPRIKEFTYIPVAVINGNIYLNFLLKGSAAWSDNFRSLENETDYSVVNTNVNNYENGKLVLSGYYRDVSRVKGITVSPPVYEKELLSFFIDGDSIYHIRYWESNMEYTYDQAYFSDGEKTFSVDKFIRCGGKLYQCTTGRSTRIRNIEKSSGFTNDFVSDIDGIIIAFGKPYMTYVPNTGKWEELMAMVEKANARHIPLPKPLFPAPEIIIRWHEITQIEMYNPKTWNKRVMDIASDHTTVETKHP